MLFIIVFYTALNTNEWYNLNKYKPRAVVCDVSDAKAQMAPVEKVSLLSENLFQFSANRANFCG